MVKNAHTVEKIDILLQKRLLFTYIMYAGTFECQTCLSRRIHCLNFAILAIHTFRQMALFGFRSGKTDLSLFSNLNV